jgi:UDP-glucose 4-epimerase
MEEKKENLLLNIGSGKGYSVKDVVDKVNTIIHNGEMNVKYMDKRPGDVPYLVADTTKAKELIGFEPQYNLDEIIGSLK